MAFIPHKTDSGRVYPLEYLPCSAITPKVGMALVQSSGNLAIATGTDKPTYVSMVDKSEACAAGDLIPVLRILPDMVFETKNSAAFTSINKGDKVTLHTSDGMQVTATTSSGVAEVIDFDGTAVGSVAHVRFS